MRITHTHEHACSAYTADALKHADAALLKREAAHRKTFKATADSIPHSSF